MHRIVTANCHRVRHAPVVVTLVGTLLVPLRMTVAAPGDVDPTFGGGGRVSLAPGSLGNEAASAIQQADGKIVLAGWVSGRDYQESTQLLLVRLEADGSLDNAFGNAGVVIGAEPQESAAAIVQQRDGRLVVAGRNSQTSQASLWRFNADGTVDASFGSSGTVNLEPVGLDRPRGLAQQSSDKLVVAGTTDADAADMILARFNLDGSLDTTFGSGGTAIVSFAPHGAPEIAHVLMQQPDGKLVVIGDRDIPERGSLVGGIVAAARTTVDGVFDSTFGGDGSVELPVNYRITGFEGTQIWTSQLSASLQADGKIVVHGIAGADGDFGGFLLRMTGSGAPDGDFGANGVVFEHGRSGAGGVTIEHDGKIVTAGSERAGSNGGTDMTLIRYEPEGEIDTTFGMQGTSIVDFRDLARYMSATALVHQADGKLVVVGAGSGNLGVNPILAIARLVGGDTGFGGLIGFSSMTFSALEDADSVTVTVRRTAGSTGPVSVLYETIDGTATAGSDFTSTNGVLNWADGDSASKSVAVNITNDTTDENDETFTVTLSNPSADATLGSSSIATVTILDSDPPGGGGGGGSGGGEGGGGRSDRLFLLGLLLLGLARKRTMSGTDPTQWQSATAASADSTGHPWPLRPEFGHARVRHRCSRGAEIGSESNFPLSSA